MILVMQDITCPKYRAFEVRRTTPGFNGSNTRATAIVTTTDHPDGGHRNFLYWGQGSGLKNTNDLDEFVHTIKYAHAILQFIQETS